MSCCANTECIDVYINDCSSTVTIPVIANQSGVWKMFVEFNGIEIKQAYYFTQGQNIVLENKFNSGYTHTLKIYDPNGILFNDTCYMLIMNPTVDATGTTPPQPATITTDLTFSFTSNPQSGHSGAIDDPIQVLPGNTIIIPQLAGKIVHNPVWLNGYTVQDMPYTSSTTTFDNTARGGFLQNDLLTIQYEK